MNLLKALQLLVLATTVLLSHGLRVLVIVMVMMVPVLSASLLLVRVLLVLAVLVGDLAVMTRASNR